MHKTIDRPQSFSSTVLRKILIPILAILIVITELLEFIDALFFEADDTWQMRVFFYTGYLVVAPIFLLVIYIFLF